MRTIPVLPSLFFSTAWLYPIPCGASCIGVLSWEPHTSGAGCIHTLTDSYTLSISWAWGSTSEDGPNEEDCTYSRSGLGAIWTWFLGSQEPRADSAMSSGLQGTSLLDLWIPHPTEKHIQTRTRVEPSKLWVLGQGLLSRVQG